MDARYSWLHDLTEDWPSQPPSEGHSIALPALKVSSGSGPFAGRSSAGSKIPRPSSAANRSSISRQSDVSPPAQALNERSANDINIRAPTRSPSKLSRELRQPPQDGQQHQRQPSENNNWNDDNHNRMSRGFAESLASRGSMAGSVIHNTVHVNKAGPNKGDTPEWRRRLVNGRTDYGEQMDLFSGAANGLKKMFDPPSQRRDGGPSQPEQVEEDAHDEVGQNTTWPSSPPAWKSLVTPAPLDELDDEFDGDKADDSPSPSPRKPRQTQFRANDSFDADHRSFDHSPASFEDEGYTPSEGHTPNGSGLEEYQEGYQEGDEYEDPEGDDYEYAEGDEYQDQEVDEYEEDPEGDLDFDGSDGSVIRQEEDDHHSRDSSLERHNFWRPGSSKSGGGDNSKPSSLTAPVPQEETRKVSSGHSVVHNEDFSEISIEKRVAGDGKVDFTPAIKAEQLRDRLERLRSNQMAYDSRKRPFRETDGDGDEDEQDDRFNSSPEYERPAGFLNFRRGARRGEGSYVHKVLSSVLATDTSEMLPEDSLQASTPKQFPSYRADDSVLVTRAPRTDLRFSPKIPAAPYPSPQKATFREAAASNGGDGAAANNRTGSPLKLFGDHNTYTRGMLMRRLSQFEDPEMDDEDEDDNPDYDRSPPSTDAYGLGDGDYRSEFDVTPAPRMPTHNTPYPPRGRTVSYFGRGDLEGYEFEAELETEYFSELEEYVEQYSDEQYDDEDGHDEGDQQDADHLEEEDHSGRIDQGDGTADQSAVSGDDENIAPEPGRTPNPKFRFNITESSPSAKAAMSAMAAMAVPKRQRSLASLPFPPLVADRDVSDARKSALVATPTRAELSVEMKRPRGSPSKDPTPKRRRTLHRSDIAYGRELLLNPAVGPNAQIQMQALIAHNINMALHNNESASASPGSDAMTGVTPLTGPPGSRAGTPTPAGNRPRQQSVGGQTTTSINYPRSPTRTRSRDDQDSAVAAGQRKGSIGTHDYLQEAGKIMAMIRNQVRPNGLSSVEESEAENSVAVLDDSFQESTAEPLSRPPSRDGAPVTRLARQHDDPELLNRLKQYQEFSDFGDIITSSLRSMGLAREAVVAAQEIERRLIQQGQARSLSRQANDDDGEARTADDDATRSDDDTDRNDYPSTLSGHSTNRTIGTGSSRGEMKKTIAPQSVSHLIPDQVGSMVLDREKNLWIKKRPRVASLRRSRTAAPGEDSEEDPFASIPDLSVDLAIETNNLRLASPRRAQVSTPRPKGRSTTPSLSPSPRGYVTLSPHTALTRDMLSQARDELNKLESKNSSRRCSRESNSSGVESEQEDEDEEDEGVDEGENEKHSEKETSMHDHDKPATPRRKHLTISFSSPIASIIQDMVVADDLDDLSDDPETTIENESFHGVSRDVRYQSLSKSLRSQILPRLKPIMRTPSLQFSADGQSDVPRPESRIDEDEDEAHEQDDCDNFDDSRFTVEGKELEIADYQDESSLILHDVALTAPTALLSTPGKRAAAAVHPDNSAILNSNVGMLSLSPLSEFTMHQHDPSFGFEASYVLGDKYLVTGDASKRVLSKTLRDLVERLADVQPYDPDWDHVAELDLHDRRLDSLHGLDQFCGGLVTLNASDNALGHLDGVPRSVRELKVTGNLLSELTSWHHLVNLQYVDISNNDVKSLSGLKQLVHLRSLRADNNNLASLDGLSFHDGLLSLRARDNQMTEIDFGVLAFRRLTDLDLCGNEIAAVHGLEQAPSLTTLKLQRNQLHSFDSATSVRHSALRHLDLTDNNLETLDVSKFTGLHLLHADRNCLASVTGFSKTRHLDSLSLREQRGAEPLDVSSFLDSAYEIRKLFLSGNNIGAFSPRVDYLNLQLLEVANCGLQALPQDLGQLMPNLRTLNVNFNAIADLGPIRFISRLKKLLAAGNRLADSARVTALLTEFPHLNQLDLRDNPVTQGFYAPMQLSTGGSGSHALKASLALTSEPFSLPGADPQRDMLFSRRLDAPTAMRRRLYRVVFVASCRRLRTLDGLPVDRAVVLARDEGFMALVREGLLPDVEAPKETKKTRSKKKKDHDSGSAERTISTTPSGTPTRGTTPRPATAMTNTTTTTTTTTTTPLSASASSSWSRGKRGQEEVVAEEGQDESSRWGVEDSFA